MSRRAETVAFGTRWVYWESGERAFPNGVFVPNMVIHGHSYVTMGYPRVWFVTPRQQYDNN